MDAQYFDYGERGQGGLANHTHCGSSSINRNVTIRTPHEQQMDGFLYTVFILMFYAVTMLYFMLRQICRQERRNREQFYRLRFVTSDYAVAKEERMHRSQMKKQLCVHLIKMGQLTQAFVTTANKTYANDLQQRPLVRSMADSDSISHGKEQIVNNFASRILSVKHMEKIKTLTRDQATITDDPVSTIIHIESDNSDASI